MDSSVSLKDEIWFLCVCHHVSNAVYCLDGRQSWYGRFVEDERVVCRPDVCTTAYCLATALNELAHLHHTLQFTGTRWRSWLRHCVTSQKVAGSIPDGIIGIFN